MLLWRAKEDGVVCMGLHVLLEILGALKGLSTEVAFVRLQWDVDANVGSDVVTLDSGCPARAPSARKVEIICTLSSNVLLTNMFLSAN